MFDLWFKPAGAEHCFLVNFRVLRHLRHEFDIGNGPKPWRRCCSTS